MSETLTVLGLESSCDETAAAIIALTHKGGVPVSPGDVRSNQLLSQIDLHAPYGGVVPEIAARAHLSHMDGLVGAALDEAGLTLNEIDAVAATAGPGLIGGVLIGLTMGKALALASGKPFIGVNHLEGHALSVRLNEPVAFPYLLLLVSGGHCQLLGVTGLGQYEELGTTRDDAVGEAFDKAAKLMSLGYPGGPEIERRALTGRADAYPLPRPLLDRRPTSQTDSANRASDCDFSFSGLKTALWRQAERLAPLSDTHVADLAASFQAAILDCLVDRSSHAMRRFRQISGRHDTLPFVVAGGVAANRALRSALAGRVGAHDYRLYVPPAALCTDNAAMIAWAGGERLAAGQLAAAGQSAAAGQLATAMAIPARARWPLAEMADPIN